LLASPLCGEAIRVVAERADGSCPSKAPPLGIVALRPGSSPPALLQSCLVLVPVEDLSDGALAQLERALASLTGIPGFVLDFSNAAEAAADSARLSFAVRKLSSAARAGSPAAPVALDLAPGLAPPPSFFEEIRPYWDAAVERTGRGPMPAGDDQPPRWIFSERSGTGDAVDQLLRILIERPSASARITLLALRAGPAGGVSEADWKALSRLQSYWTEEVSGDPTATRAAREDGSAARLLRFYDGKRFTPILLLPSDQAGAVRIDLPPAAYRKASVENLSSGGRREFEIAGASGLTLDLSLGPLAVVLQPAKSPGETRAAVEVEAERGLTADEIVARERAWDARQRERLTAFIADMNTSLRFRIGEVNETFDLTIRGPFFFRRGEPGDWAWQEFYLNGVRWKGKTLPKLPILQPEKVTTLPLDIRLTEDYAYELHGEASVGGRRAYHITYVPKSTIGDEPIYRGSVWIDKETFALLRRESIQLNLKGETLSNIQNEYYRPVPGESDIVLPLEIRGQQVFSTAGRTTAIERHVRMSRVAVNPEDFEARRRALHASQAQMVRDTERGLRYLIPDPAAPGGRIVEEKVSKESTFGLAGGFYDDSLDYPIPLLGIQHFNFDLWGKGKQISVFFGGALLTANYTDPALAGSRFDLGVDLFAVAFPFGDVSYREGREVPSEKIKHLPALLQINIGRPIGPYLKTSLGLFTKWDNYQRDQETGPDFLAPVDTFTDGGELRLVGNVSGFNATVLAGYYRRRKWEAWGEPATSEFEPGQRDYFKYSLSLSKDQYFSGFRKLHVGVSYLGGRDLDRFSKYEFGAFSGTPLRGFKSGSLRTEQALVAGISYGLNIEDIIRFEGFLDQAVLRDRSSGFDDTYFAGAGILGSLNGPWENSLLRFEVGVPVVRHGVDGFVVSLVLLKLF
jgi:hypothetical protein